MPASTLGHLQVNIHMVNKNFYKDLFTFLGWKVLMEAVFDDGTEMLGIEDERRASLWFVEPIHKQQAGDYDGIGMNHLALSVPDPAAVDETVAYLKQHGVPALFETPRHRPEFCDSPDTSYYQVMFESPDHILFEVVYTGLK